MAEAESNGCPYDRTEAVSTLALLLMLKIRYLWILGAIACHGLWSALPLRSQPVDQSPEQSPEQLLAQPLPPLQSLHQPPHPQRQRQEAQLGAIVQVQELNLPDPQVSGQTTVPLGLLQESRGVYVLDVELLPEPLLPGASPPTASSSEPLSGRFLLDTGASTTLLSGALRQKLGLEGEPIESSSLNYAVAGKDCPEMTARRLTLPPLQIDSAQVRQLDVLQFDQTLIPEGADGVLGMDVLDQFQMILDPSQRRLTLQPPQPPSPAERLWSIPLESRSGVMLAQLSINEQGPFTVLLDTAADGTFISREVAEQLNLTGRKPIKMLGFCGLEAAEMATLEQVTLHWHRRRNLQAVITDSSVLSTLRIDGVLGQNFLNYFRQSWYFSDEESLLTLELIQK